MRRRFDVREVSADMGYLSRSNVEGIEQLGARPLIPFKVNSTCASNAPESWKRMWALDPIG